MGISSKIIGGGMALIVCLASISCTKNSANQFKGLAKTGLSAPFWTGILAPARAMDWSGAGVQGGIPNYTIPCSVQPSLASGSGSASSNSSSINSAIASCDSAHNVVNLPAGTFYFNGINFSGKSNAVVRGAGADATFLIAVSGASVNCNGAGSLICLFGQDSTYWIPGTGNSWTGGFSQGLTSITLSNTSGVSPGKLIVLNQCDTGFSGVSCNAGSSTDNGGYFNAGTQCNSNGKICTTGASLSGPDSGNGTPLRFQAELFAVTGVSGTTVSLSGALKHPNWSTGSTPQAWTVTPISNSGVENLSIDNSADTTALYSITLFSSLNSWVKGVRILNGYISPVAAFISSHFTIQDNYFWETQYSDSHAVHLTVTSDGLVQNNIWQQIIVPIVIEGDDAGTVFGYNYSIGNCNYQSKLANCASDGLQQMARPHSNGVDFELYEGNAGTNYDSDGDHGTALSQTLFRNFFTGWESCGTSGPCGSTTQKDFLTNPMIGYAYVARYHNLVANVLGTPGYHSTYQWVNGSLDNHAIYAWAGPVSGGVPPYDPLAYSTLMRWGNYDVTNNAVLECTGDGIPTSACTSDERGASAPTYPALTTPVTTFPASFYLASKPAWFGNNAFPAIGPDVSSGNVGQCAGALNVANQFNGLPASSSSQCKGSSMALAWAGHVNLIPAMACYLNTMGGTLDGTGGSALAFNAAKCYGGSTPPPPSVVAAPSCTPSGGTISAQSIPCSSATSGATLCFRNDGTAPTTNGAGVCGVGSTTYTAAIPVAASTTIQMVASKSGFTDSSLVSFSYVINAPPPPTSQQAFTLQLNGENVLRYGSGLKPMSQTVTLQCAAFTCAKGKGTVAAGYTSSCSAQCTIQ